MKEILKKIWLQVLTDIKKLKDEEIEIKVDEEEETRKFNKALIYDSQGRFSNLLTQEFSEKYVFEVYTNNTFEKFKEESEDYTLVVFVVYSNGDLLDFLKIYERSFPIFLCSFEKRIYKETKNIHGLITVDLTRHRLEVLKELEWYFNIMSIEKTDGLKM
ncbi:hypothetical protein OOZ15_18660 [Galbibacter sp. EGI 63066]|uniref:hypothetical protein n=1 Tax=Galbibacter sp. EGI 63066 TaxID=2993559 RepID=UPI0022490826|nr:hypothetical protein [Galbibacter sp. EGI 63066]MCX2681980.1 hypothetical protein [Galbibacter sp. EGI 63066]